VAVEGLPEEARRSADILLDTLLAYERATEDDKSPATRLALQRLTEAGAVTATLGADDSLTIDLSRLLAGTLVPMEWLTVALADSLGISTEQVVNHLRAFLDTQTA
jgi:hypothetical protein